MSGRDPEADAPGGIGDYGLALIFFKIPLTLTVMPPLRDVFGMAPLAFGEYSALFAAPPIMLALEEGRKWVQRKKHGA